MKKAFLLFGLFAGIGAVGQNNDLLDIQKLIKDRQARDAEKNKLLTPQLRYLAPDTAPEYYLLPSGDQVVHGNGSMPIVKPDMRNFVLMPNQRIDMNDFRTMPNAAKNNFFSEGPNNILDQLAPSPVLEKLLKKYGK